MDTRSALPVRGDALHAVHWLTSAVQGNRKTEFLTCQEVAGVVDLGLHYLHTQVLCKALLPSA
jgi:hypothetical protein